jgi:hypothetical protein
MASAVQGLGPRRKRNMIWGYVLAAGATITMVLLLVGAFAPLLQGSGGEAAAGIIITLCTFIPASIGFAVASSACEVRLPNSMALWGAIIWNLLLVLAFLALTVIGLFFS